MNVFDVFLFFFFFFGPITKKIFQGYFHRQIAYKIDVHVLLSHYRTPCKDFNTFKLTIILCDILFILTHLFYSMR